jgi:hypothetical protein
MLGIGDASAGWHSSASSLDGGTRVRITSKPLPGLYPGATKALALIVHNRDRRRGVLVDRLRVRNTTTSRRGCAPSRRNLAIRQYTGPAFALPPRASRRIVVRLRMPYTVASACQRVVFRLRYSARVRTRGGSR